MRTSTDLLVPSLFEINSHLSDDIKSNIVQSEIEGGVYLRDLRRGDVLEIETQDWVCRLVYCGDYEALVSGHPRLCPKPTRVQIAGSTWGGSMLKQYFIGRGMHLEFMHPICGRVLTSVILEIQQDSARFASSFVCQ